MNRMIAPGPVMFDVRGTELADDECAWLSHSAAAGVILFRRNYQDPAQLAGLVGAIRAVRPDALIAVDHEGGRVQRFHEGFTCLPPVACLAKTFATDSAGAERDAQTLGWLMAAELRAMDLDFSFAPVLDVDAGVSEIIGDRAFAREAEIVTRLALAYRRGMRRAGMAAVGKHFPGHGHVAADSHLILPVDTRSLAEIEARDLQPYPALIAAGLEGIMPAHVLYPEVDDQPAGFSRFWLRDVLRGHLGFDGAIFSDDLSMEGAAGVGSYAERAQRALDAGCDVLLICNRPEAIAEVLDAASSIGSAERIRRLQAMRGRGHMARDTLMASDEWHAARALADALCRETA